MSTPSTLALVLFIAPAIAQFQVVHDVPNTTTTPEITPLILADGNVVTHQWSDGEHIFRKYDEMGALVWSKGFSGALPWIGRNGDLMRKDDTDGFVFAQLISTSSTQMGEWPSFYYQNELTFGIGSVNGNGEVTSMVHVKKSYASNDGGVFLDGMDMDRTPDGGTVLIFKEGSPISTMEVVKISANGTFAWAKRVGRQVSPSFPDMVWTFDFDGYPKLRVSPNGNIFYTEGSEAPGATFRLAGLDPTGEMLWMKRYNYGNTFPIIHYRGFGVDGVGSVHVGGALSSSVGQFQIFLRTNADGVLDRTDIYRSPVNFYDASFGLDGQARRVLHQNNGSFVADTTGAPGHLLQPVEQVVLPNNVFFLPNNMSTSGNRLAISGLLNHEDVNIAYTTRYESLLSFEGDDYTSCFMSDTLLAHIPVPLNTMTTEQDTNAVSFDISELFSTEQVTLAFTDLGTEPYDAICAFTSEILGVQLGIAEGVSNTAPLVTQTLVQQGTPLLLNGNGVNQVDVFTASGKLVQRSQLNGSRTLQTTSWTPGVYVLRSVSDARVAKVVVE